MKVVISALDGKIVGSCVRANKYKERAELRKGVEGEAYSCKGRSIIT